MQNYKTNYPQMREIFECLINGWSLNDMQEFQGYMRISLVNEEQTEIKEFDMETIIENY